jgi:lipopolysaccharide/colanic/teichoic acid biosynthesis glycosyltransferase
MIKRAFDLVVAAVGLVALSPLLLCIAGAILVTSQGPLFFRGVRVGLNGRLFRILKFRTMVIDAEARGGPSTAADDPRITPVGAFLRRYKLDEIPQLINVVAGDMSLVGPRPQVQSDVARYTAEERALLSVRPGITDYASIRFRDEGEILRGQGDPDAAYDRLIRPEKIRLGLEYVRRRSFLVDVGILCQTVFAMFRHESTTLSREEPKRS